MKKAIELLKMVSHNLNGINVKGDFNVDCLAATKKMLNDAMALLKSPAGKPRWETPLGNPAGKPQSNGAHAQKSFGLIMRRYITGGL
jgi:hypothetical protein